MSIAPIQNANLFQPTAPPPVLNLVKRVALKVFKEMAFIALFSGVVACFVATPAGLTFMMSSLAVQLAVSTFFHTLGAFASHKASQGSARYAKVASACEWITGSNFAIGTGFNTQTLVHESGHALASMLIYQRPRPTIEIYPFVGGLTQFYKTGLTSFGQKLGPARSTCFILASGPGLTLLVSAAVLAIGVALFKTHPELGKYLIAWSGLDFVHHAVYAYSALGAARWHLSHDFVHLAIFGLHPVAATVGIIAIPILIAAGMWWRRSSNF